MGQFHVPSLKSLPLKATYNLSMGHAGFYNRSMKLLEKIENLDKALLLAIVTLMGVGLVQVYSSSFIFAIETQGDGLFFFKKQVLFVGLGLLVLLGTMMMPFPFFKKLSVPIWILAIGALLLTLIPGIGSRAGGAARWIDLPMGFRFEPSEFLKVALSLLLATFVANQEKTPHRWRWPLRAFLIGLPALILLKQPDFGSLVIISLVILTIAFAFGLKWKYLVGAALTVVPIMVLLVVKSPYRMARIKAFLDPWADPERTGFQVIQSLLSFHSGGVTGVGLGQGQGKLFFLPEAHTDFTLAVLGEEMGFVGFTAVLLIYFFIVYRCFQLSLRTEDRFIRSLVLGLAVSFSATVIINMGVVLGMFPTKGLTLPFLSYGGSSLVMNCFLFGLILNCDLQVEATAAKRVFFQLLPTERS